MIKTQVLKQLPGARESKGGGSKEDVKGEQSKGEQLPEERWRRVGMSGSLRERMSEEMTQLNTSFPRASEVP